jgi:hypothetical protein
LADAAGDAVVAGGRTTGREAHLAGFERDVVVEHDEGGGLEAVEATAAVHGVSSGLKIGEDSVVGKGERRGDDLVRVGGGG